MGPVRDSAVSPGMGIDSQALLSQGTCLQLDDSDEDGELLNMISAKKQVGVLGDTAVPPHRGR